MLIIYQIHTPVITKLIKNSGKMIYTQFLGGQIELFREKKIEFWLNLMNQK